MAGAIPSEAMPPAAFAELRRRVGQRYAARSRYTQGYVGWKLRLDPVHRAVLDLAAAEPFGEVLDLGCGRGQLGLALLEAGLATGLTGIDWDERELADARAAADGRAGFAMGDLRSAALPQADTVLLIDVLYQLPEAAQLDLLRRAASSARSRLIVRTFDPGRGWRSLMGWLSEAGIWAGGLYRQTAVKPTPVSTLTAALAAEGFACRVEPCWAGTPLPNVLLVARRP